MALGACLAAGFTYRYVKITEKLLENANKSSNVAAKTFESAQKAYRVEYRPYVVYERLVIDIGEGSSDDITGYSKFDVIVTAFCSNYGKTPGFVKSKLIVSADSSLSDSLFNNYSEHLKSNLRQTVLNEKEGNVRESFAVFVPTSPKKGRSYIELSCGDQIKLGHIKDTNDFILYCHGIFVYDAIPGLIDKPAKSRFTEKIILKGLTITNPTDYHETIHESWE